METNAGMDTAIPVGGKMVDGSERMDRTGEEFRQAVSDIIKSGKRVVLVYPIPEVGWNVPQYISKAVWFGANISRPLSTSYSAFKERVRNTYRELDAIGENDSLLRVEPEVVFCNATIAGRCVAEDVKEGPFYADDDHVDSIGAAMISREIIEAMRRKGWI